MTNISFPRFRTFKQAIMSKNGKSQIPKIN